MEVVKLNSAAINLELSRALDNVIRDALHCKLVQGATATASDIAYCILLLKGLRS